MWPYPQFLADLFTFTEENSTEESESESERHQNEVNNFIVSFEKISHLFLALLLLTFNR